MYQRDAAKVMEEQFMNAHQPESPVFCLELVISNDVIDGNNHVNNVAYVQWMQDAAVAHSRACIGPGTVRALGYTWVARSHYIEYLRPGMTGDALQIRTWLTEIRRVRCQRKYEFYRTSDEQLIAQGETDWVLVSAETGRPCSIPQHIRSAFPVQPDAERP